MVNARLVMNMFSNRFLPVLAITVSLGLSAISGFSGGN